MIFNSVDKQYINDLCNSVTKHALVTPINLLDHLWATYGDIDKGDLSTVEERTKLAWTPPTPIAILFKKMNKVKKYAARGKRSYLQ